MQYVALLRGINVGGKNKVAMAELRCVFAQAGMENVSTYINSGNVIFESGLSNKLEITQLLETVIETAFGFYVKVLVWDEKSFIALAQALPSSWTNDAAMRCDILFLWKEIDTPDILTQLTIRPGIDTVKYLPGALLWSVSRENVTKSGMLKLVGTENYRHMTIRNCNTLRKLALLLA